jgi:hypothetical protein
MPSVKRYLHDIDLAKNKLINAKLNPVTTAERVAMSSSYNAGDQGAVVYDTDEDKLYAWTGNDWVDFGGVSNTQVNQINAAYDNIVTSVELVSTATDLSITINRQNEPPISDFRKYAHVHTQTLASATWTVIHNLGKHPSVSIVDSAEEEVIGEVQHTDANVLTIRFSAAFSGKAYLN